MSFDARVAGIPDFIAQVKDALGKDEGQFAQKKFDAAKDALSSKYGSKIGKREISKAFKERSEPQSHIGFERHGFLEPLQGWAANRNGTTLKAVREDDAWTEFPHIALLGSNDSLVLPLDFSMPLTVELDERSFPFMVASAPRLLEELKAANAVLKVESSLRNHELPPFVLAKKHEVERLEHIECLDEGFWIKFGLVALRQLAMVSFELQLPLIIEPNLIADKN